VPLVAAEFVAVPQDYRELKVDAGAEGNF